jgi:DNA-binding response OmpR family regulator
MPELDHKIQSLQEHPAVAAPVLVPDQAPVGGLVLCVSENIYITNRELVPVLKDAGFDVELVEANLSVPLDLACKPYCLVVLDISFLAGPGYEVCERARMKCNLPVMLVLHGAARNDVLRGYQAGADAYVLAPFDPREFIARMSALLRRRPAQLPQV